MNCKTLLQHHFSKSQLSLECSDPDSFIRGAWHSLQGPPMLPPYLIFRLIISTLFLAGIITSWIVWDTWSWFIYYSCWAFLICVLQSLVGATLVIRAYCKQKSANRNDLLDLAVEGIVAMPLSYKIYWVMYNIALTASFSITVVYWPVVFWEQTSTEDDEFYRHYMNNENVTLAKRDLEVERFSFLNFVIHGGSSVLCVAELLVGGLPSRFLHVLHTIFFSLVYIIFNIFYWIAGGMGLYGTRFVYAKVNWEDQPLETVGRLCLGIWIVVGVHTLICVVAELRTILNQKLQNCLHK